MGGPEPLAVSNVLNLFGTLLAGGSSVTLPPSKDMSRRRKPLRPGGREGGGAVG